MKPLKIYVAGPYSKGVKFTGEGKHDISRKTHQRVREAIRVGITLIEKGHYPFILHLTHYIHLEADKDYGRWYYEYDNVWLDLCDAIFVMPHTPDCKGVIAEKERAIKRNMLVFTNLKDVECV